MRYAFTAIVTWSEDTAEQIRDTIVLATILFKVTCKMGIMDAFVKKRIKNGVGTVTFYHPQSNAMPGKLLVQLATAIEDLGKDGEARVILIQSEGERAFCAGASFDELISIDDLETGRLFFSGFAAVINAIRKAPKFVVARVHGKAVGGGVGIVSAADYALATADAAIKLSELTVGIGPFVVGPAVERKIGVAAFSQLAINAREFQQAEWARDKGLYAAVYTTTAELDAALEQLLNDLARSNPEAMTEIKKIYWEGTDHWDALLAKRAEISGKLVLSDFTKDAINDFKRKS